MSKSEIGLLTDNSPTAIALATKYSDSESLGKRCTWRVVFKKENGENQQARRKP
ncbi:hypothetical protein [Nostoc sp.]|uniref:hypothetical protein n=1 Tax=Nostoc sp. TaxID=1180 RepID=UPI002FFA53EE